MKTALIVLLAIALLAAAFVTRPGRREFVLYLLDARHSGGSGYKAADVDEADRLLKAVTFKDRILWTDIEKDGKVVYSGAFAHFLPRGQSADKPALSAGELARILGKADLTAR